MKDVRYKAKLFEAGDIVTVRSRKDLHSEFGMFPPGMVETMYDLCGQEFVVHAVIRDEFQEKYRLKNLDTDRIEHWAFWDHLLEPVGQQNQVEIDAGDLFALF